MESNHDNTENTTPPEGIPTDRRPLGFWLRLVDRQLTEAFATEFAADGLGRREWMLLNLLAGDVDDARLARIAKVATKRGGRLMAGLVERGWVAENDGAWTLTDAGRAQRDSLGGRVDAIRARVAAAVSPEEYATTVASLEEIAREFGWNEDERMPRGFGFGRGRRGFGPGFRGFGERGGFGPGERAGFGPGERAGFGPGERGGFGPGERPGHGFGPRGEGESCRHGGPHHHHRGHDGHQGGHRRSERSYERGFEAGFAAASRTNAPAGTAD